MCESMGGVEVVSYYYLLKLRRNYKSAIRHAPNSHATAEEEEKGDVDPLNETIHLLKLFAL